MSQQAVQQLIGELVTDGAFAKSFFENPDGALSGRDLTEDEIAGLKAMKEDELGQFSGGLDERISKMDV